MGRLGPENLSGSGRRFDEVMMELTQLSVVASATGVGVAKCSDMIECCPRLRMGQIGAELARTRERWARGLFLANILIPGVIGDSLEMRTPYVLCMQVDVMQRGREMGKDVMSDPRRWISPT